MRKTCNSLFYCEPVLFVPRLLHFAVFVRLSKYGQRWTQKCVSVQPVQVRQRASDEQDKQRSTRVRILDSKQQHPLLLWQLFSPSLCWSLDLLITDIASQLAAVDNDSAVVTRPGQRFEMRHRSDHIHSLSNYSLKDTCR